MELDQYFYTHKELIGYMRKINRFDDVNQRTLVQLYDKVDADFWKELFIMVNAWSLLYSELNGTMDE